MHPVADEGLVCCALALRYFVLVMREDEVHAAAMDVKSLAEIFHAHGRAFDMPAWPARAQFRLPEILPFLGRLPPGWPRGFPQDEIAGFVLLVPIRIHTGSRLYPAEILLAQLSVLRKARNAEINRAVPAIGIAFLLEPPDQLHHLRNMICGQRHDVRGKNPELPAVFQKCLGIARRVFLQRNPQGFGVLYDPVVDVGDVHDMADLIAAIPQIAAQQVLEHEGPEIPDMRIVIDRRAARVQPHQHVLGRLELLFGPGERVVEAQHRGLS